MELIYAGCSFWPLCGAVLALAAFFTVSHVRIRRDLKTLYRAFSAHERDEAQRRREEETERRRSRRRWKAAPDEAAEEARKAADRYLEGLNNLLSYTPAGKKEDK